MTLVIPRPGETPEELRERFKRVEERLGIYVDPENPGPSQPTEPPAQTAVTPTDADPGVPASHGGKDTPSK